MPGICIGPQCTTWLQKKTIFKKSLEERSNGNTHMFLLNLLFNHVALNADDSQWPNPFSFETSYG